MKADNVLLISYFLMGLRIVFSFLAWFDYLIFFVVLVSILDALDGFFVWKKYKPVPERKQKWDYLTDILSRTILIVPMFSFLPTELVLWFVMFYIWYYATTIMRLVTGNPEWVMFTCPLMILAVGVGILQYFNISFIWLWIFMEIGLIYEYVWHGTFYRH